MAVSATDLTGVLTSLYPELRLGGGAEEGAGASPSDVGAEVVRLLFATDEPALSTVTADLLILLEVLFDKGAEAPWDDFAWSLLEDLLNAVSHDDLPLSRVQVNAMIGPKTRSVADALDLTWAPTPSDQVPRAMDRRTYQSIDSPELRWFVRRTFRRNPGDIYVGLTDIVRREAQAGRSSQLDAG